jgi:hypothetical protein
MSRKALQAKTRAQIWGEYLNALNGMVQGLGKQFVVWGDLVLHKEPEILARLDKSIVIMDWNYWDTQAIPFHDALEKVRAKGMRGIGGPGLISYRWGPRPGVEQLRNIDAFAEAYLGPDDAASLGVILTNWVPSRYIQNSLWDVFAYAAVAFKDGAALARTSALRRFVERHFGAEWNEVWSEAFDLLYDAAPIYGDPEKDTPLGLKLPVPWSDEEQLAAALKERSKRTNPFTRVRSLLVEAARGMAKNHADFEALALSVKYLEALFWRQDVIQEHAAGKRLDRESAQVLIGSISVRDREMAEALTKDWDSGRPVDSAAKTAPLFGMEAKDQLLFQWHRAADFSARMAAHPDRFYQIVQTAGLA